MPGRAFDQEGSDDILPHFAGNVFDSFVRATDLHSGYGMGLAIVREIVLRHGGTMDLEAVMQPRLKEVIRLPLAGDT